MSQLYKFKIFGPNPSRQKSLFMWKIAIFKNLTTSLKKSFFSRLFEIFEKYRIFSKNHENPRKTTIFGYFWKTVVFWSVSSIPPKIIKNRLNFALSEKFTYVRNRENWRKISIFLEFS